MMKLFYCAYMRFINMFLEHSAVCFLSASLFFHALEVFLSIHLASLPLVILNLCSVCINTLLLLFVVRRRPALAIIASELEIILFTISSSTVTGFHSGFFLYLIALLAVSAYMGETVEGCPTVPVQLLSLLSIFVLVCTTPQGLGAALSAHQGHLLLIWNLCVCVIVTLVSVAMFSQSLRQKNQKLAQINSHLEHLASHDPLTGMRNRRNILDQLEALCTESNAAGAPLSLAMADIDDFKIFNDHYGHDVGDLILAAISECVHACVRPQDVVCRWGGEELLILFTNAPISVSMPILQQIQHKIQQLPDAHTFSQPVTITIGLAQLVPGQTAAELIAEADRRLYLGKTKGKNCIVAESLL